MGSSNQHWLQESPNLVSDLYVSVYEAFGQGFQIETSMQVFFSLHDLNFPDWAELLLCSASAIQEIWEIPFYFLLFFSLLV